jgi:hypothetical protein
LPKVPRTSGRAGEVGHARRHRGGWNLHQPPEKQKSNSSPSASGWGGARPSPESSASIGRDYLELSKGERTGNCDCADNEAMQSRRIPYMYDDDFNEDHNPMCLSALVSEYVTTMPPPASARQPRGRMLRASTASMSAVFVPFNINPLRIITSRPARAARRVHGSQAALTMHTSSQ